MKKKTPHPNNKLREKKITSDKETKKEIQKKKETATFANKKFINDDEKYRRV